MKLLAPMAGPLMATADESARVNVRTVLAGLHGPRIFRVRVTPVMWDVDGTPQLARSVLLLDGLGREIPTPRGAHKVVVDVLRAAFPDQWFDVACEYGVASGELHRYDVPVPSFLRVAA
ncbi:hypothetical protein ACFV9E_06505 [Streptomyces sp. NPDC059835]|uniref:hypothetical protein n=1 Tax=Streptomyces sp. NPDC059835 TaxID=3346967 RepID=UPI00364CA46C